MRLFDNLFSINVDFNIDLNVDIHVDEKILDVIDTDEILDFGGVKNKILDSIDIDTGIKAISLLGNLLK